MKKVDIISCCMLLRCIRSIVLGQQSVVNCAVWVGRLSDRDSAGQSPVYRTPPPIGLQEIRSGDRRRRDSASRTAGKQSPTNFSTTDTMPRTPLAPGRSHRANGKEFEPFRRRIVGGHFPAGRVAAGSSRLASRIRFTSSWAECEP